MFLLIQNLNREHRLSILTLHSTMFLLIQQTWLWKQSLICSFTFHNVSINTVTNSYPVSRNALFTFHNVSINTFSFPTADAVLHDFTFHNVSINTEKLAQNPIWQHPLHSTMFLLILFITFVPIISAISLHSTMFLLIRERPEEDAGAFVLYIPQCFY